MRAHRLHDFNWKFITIQVFIRFELFIYNAKFMAAQTAKQNNAL